MSLTVPPATVGATAGGGIVPSAGGGGDGGVSPGPAVGDGQTPRVAKKVSCLAYAGYYLLLFWSFWFGASRLDMDGDGDFDPSDVQAYLENEGVLARSFRQSRTSYERRRKHQRQASRKAEKQRREFVKKAQAEGRPPPQNDREISQMYGVEIDDITVEDVVKERYLEKQIPPYFVMLQTLMMFLLWLVNVVKVGFEQDADIMTTSAGLDTAWPQKTDLRWATGECGDLRLEIWRLWTYQFTHVGLSHILANCTMLILFGIPLEGIHGSFRTWLVWTLGVIGGAGAFFVVDAHNVVVGASGGCVALLGMHLADLIINWRQRRFRCFTLLVLIFMQAVDAAVIVLGIDGGKTSWASHMGGYIAGLTSGVAMGRNLKVYQWERMVVCWQTSVFVVLAAFVIVWVLINEGPRNIFDVAAGTPPYCWIRQVYSTKVGTGWECVSCWSETCIRSWHEITSNIAPVAKASCQTKGYFFREDEAVFTGL